MGYPWGNYPHENEKAPDHYALDQVGKFLSNDAWYNTRHPEWKITKYVVGDMTSTVYAVKGGFEDWAYGGWDTPNVPFCKSTVLPKYSLQEVKYEDNMLRSFTYLVEASDVKNPATKTLGNWNDVTHTGSNSDGHVSRNIRMSLDFIRIAAPYVIFQDLKLNKQRKEVIVTYKAGGCFKIDGANIVFPQENRRLLVNNKKGVPTKVKIHTNGKGFMSNPRSVITARFKVKDINKKLNFNISLVCDQGWGKSPPGIPLQPQSHLVRMRTLEKFETPITNNGYSLDSYKDTTYTVPDFVPGMLGKYQFNKDERDRLIFKTKRRLKLKLHKKYNRILATAETGENDSNT